MATTELIERLGAFEKTLGLREGFIAGLRHEDDWSFVIKAHAILEAGISQLLAHELGNPGLADVFARLDMASGFGKLAFGEALGVIDKPTRRFVRTLGEIRNDFVHNIANVGASLTDYLKRLDKQQLKSKHLALDLLFAADEPIAMPGNKNARPLDVFAAYPKAVIAPSLALVLVDIHSRTSTAKIGQEMRRTADELLRDAFLSNRGKTLGELVAEALNTPDEAPTGSTK